MTEQQAEQQAPSLTLLQFPEKLAIVRLGPGAEVPEPGRPIPSRDRTIDSTSTTARLVAMNRMMRFIERPPDKLYRTIIYGQQ